MNDKLLYKHLSFVFLCLKVTLKLSILLRQCSILIVNPLGNVGDQLKMMSQLILTLFLFRSLVTTLCFFFLYRFLRTGDETLVLSSQLLGLLILQLFELVIVIIDVFVDIIEVASVCDFICFRRPRHQSLSDSELSVK